MEKDQQKRLVEIMQELLTLDPEQQLYVAGVILGLSTGKMIKKQPA